MEGASRTSVLRFVGITGGQPGHPTIPPVGDARGVGVARAVLVNKGSVELHVGGRGSRTLVLVRDADVVGSTVLRNRCGHAVVVDGAVHTATAREQAIVGGVLGVRTALALVGSVAEVGVGSTAGGPGPVVRSDVAGTGRIGCAERGRHVGHVDVLVGVILLDGVVRIRTAARLRTVAAVVRGDVLAKDDVTGAGGLGVLLDHRFFFEFERCLVEFAHHPRSKASEEDGDDGKSEATHSGVHVNSTKKRVYETHGVMSKRLGGEIHAVQRRHRCGEP